MLTNYLATSLFW